MSTTKPTPSPWLRPWCSSSIALGLGLLLGACVTINVYFPAAAAEKAADRIINEVWGPDAGKGSEGAPATTPAPQSSREPAALRLALRLLEVIVPSASAQANLEISTPAINALQASMKARHARLEPFYGSGAVGLTDEGLVAVHDAKAVGIQDRPTVNRLVAEENQDRNALYRAIASANGHPEWEPDIRATFARRWIDKAASGWWFESGGVWAKR